MTSLLTLTTTPIEITDGIEYLLAPLKKVNFPVHELALMMSISLTLYSNPYAGNGYNYEGSNSKRC